MDVRLRQVSLYYSLIVKSSFIFSGPIAESPAKSSPVASISSLKEKIRSPFGKAKAENTRKIQLMLEETLTKNVQLQRVRY